MEAIAREGLSFVRFILVWSGLSPIFLLWAVRGTKAVDQSLFAAVCMALFLVPTLALWALWERAKDKNSVRTIFVINSEEPKDHLLIYLFAMLMPLFQSNIDDARQLLVSIMALLLVLFIFWRMKLHYMNIIFSIFDYNIFSVKVNAGIGVEGAKTTFTYVVISKRNAIPEGELTGYRLGGLVLADKTA